MKYFEQAMMKKRLLSIFAVLGIFGLFLMLPQKTAYAINYAFCEPDKTVFEKVGDAFTSLDIRKSVQNMIASAATDGIMNVVANRNPSQMMRCSWYILQQNRTQNTKILKDIETACPNLNPTDHPDIVRTLETECVDFVQMYQSGKYYYNIGGQRLGFNETTTSGSLLGLANALEGAVRTEPLPTNLAYFWNDSIKKMPFAGTALAADVSYGNAPLITVILEIWKIFRNLAFGLLSIAMLITGVMIMTRRKLSPQLVVTAQYALPRIVLAVILIVFSYPIGAVMASSMRYLTDLMAGIILGTAIGSIMSLGEINAYALAGPLNIVGAAIPMLILTCVFILVIIVLYVAVWFKAILIYMKLIVSIVLAPVNFALGVIPGNEAMTGNWFKHAAVNVASYVGMFTFLNMGLFILVKLVEAPPMSVGTGISQFFTLLLFPVIVVWILLQTLKVPGKIETLIMGEPKRPPRK